MKKRVLVGMATLLLSLSLLMAQEIPAGVITAFKRGSSQELSKYIQRTKRSITFDMEVIPELKNTKSLSMEVQKEKEGELILKALQPGDVVVLLDEH